MTNDKLQQAQDLKDKINQLDVLIDEDYLNIGLVTFDDDAMIDRFDREVIEDEQSIELGDEWRQDILYSVRKDCRELYISLMNKAKQSLQQEFDNL